MGSTSDRAAAREKDRSVPIYLEAGLWGLLAASGLVIGAGVALLFHERLSHRTIAGVMGFGGGVLVAVMSVELIQKAFMEGRAAAVAGFLAGGALFSAINWRLARQGAENRARCGECVEQPSEAERPGSGAAIAVGSVIDGVPESLVVGLSLMQGGTIGMGLVAGFFLANVPQGLSSAAGMIKAGRSKAYIAALWTGIVLISGLAAAAGNLLLGSADPAVSAAILAFAAGGVLAMLAETMIPEAFENAQPFIGLITVLGFLASFLIIKAHG